jgi:hypothetical protein
VIIYGLILLLLPRDPPMITGRSENTQGANTVRIPARNERNNSDIYKKCF